MFDKRIIGFLTAVAAGQGIQLLLLFMCQSITYATNQFVFCLVSGIITMVLLLVGVGIALGCSYNYAGEHEEDIGMLPHKSYADLKVEIENGQAANQVETPDDFSDVIPAVFTAEDD